MTLPTQDPHSGHDGKGIAEKNTYLALVRVQNRAPKSSSFLSDKSVFQYLGNLNSLSNHICIHADEGTPLLDSLDGDSLRKT